MPGRVRVRLAAMLLLGMTSTLALRAQDNGNQQPQTAGTEGQSPQGSQTPPPPTTSGTQAPPPGIQNPIGQEIQSGEGGTSTDTRPLAGALAILPELPGAERSFLISSFSVWEGADTNAILQPGYQGFAVAAIPAGSLDLHLLGRQNTFDAGYSGGGILYENDGNQSSPFESVVISDSYNARRWNFFISGRGTYLPQASQGFGGIGFAGIFNNIQSLGLGSGNSQLNPVYNPEQSILTGRFGVSSATGITQFQYFLTPRTSVSVMGSIGYQYFTQNGLLGSNDEFAVFSVDHQLSATESVSFAYSITKLHFSGGSVAMSENLWRGGWGHRVSNHLTLSVLGGPQLTYSAVRGVFGVQEKLNWSAQGTFGYSGERDSATLYFLHYLTPGSGVFQGAETTSASLGFNRELARSWNGNVNIGWAYNTGLSSYSVNPLYIRNGSVNSEYISTRLSHDLGRSMRWFAVYEFEREEAGSPIITGTNDRLLLRHIFGMGIEWHPRPLGL